MLQGVGGWEERVGREEREGWVGRGGGKNLQVKTQGDQLPTDGPDHTTRPKGHHSGQG